jgi:nucleoside-diphosphate-sugar epimerase
VKVFLAGATGAVGRPLVRRLVDNGHDVVGLTRTDERARWLYENSAQAVVGSALDTDWLKARVIEAQPEVVIDQMTNLPQKIGFRGLRRFYKHQNPLRIRGSGALLEGAVQAGARRLIAQSVAFIYAPDGGGIKTESDRTWDDAPEPFGEALRVAGAHDRQVVRDTRIEGIVLRYGVFYGPGTHYEPGHGVYEDIRRRRMPLVGDGDSVWSFCHVDDAAQAALLALERGDRGVYNVVDDEPAAMRDWLPYVAQLIAAKPPPTVPRWLARLTAGPAITAWATQFPGASNAKARAELGFSPEYPSWRDGFAQSLPVNGTGVLPLVGG